MLGEDKHPVIVLKDVSVKYLLLILEYIYCGRVDLSPEEVDEFKKVAESMKINVAFNVEPEPSIESHQEKMSQDLMTGVSSTNAKDEEMNSLTEGDDSMEPSYEDLMEPLESSAPMTLSIASVKSLSSHPQKHSPDSIKNGPPLKRIKIKQESCSPIKIRIPTKRTIPATKPDISISGQCIYCDSSIREKDRNYHQKFCWNNNSRVVSDCPICPKKFQFPPKLRQHIAKAHPETSSSK